MTSENFKLFLDDLNLTPEEFGNKIGTGNSGIYKILRGDTKKISNKLCNKILEAFPQFTLSDIKALNSSQKVIKLKEEGEIRVQKVVDMIIQHYDEFEQNKDFKRMLERHSIRKFTEYLDSLKERLDKNHFN